MQPGNAPDTLVFADSESKAVGMSGSFMDTIRENAPRIVGGLKLAGDLTTAFSLDPFMIGYSAFAITSRVLLMVYGTKENQRKVAQETGAREAEPSTLGKALHPRKYPVESSAGLAMIAELFETGYGVESLVNAAREFAKPVADAKQKGFDLSGLSPLSVGLVSLWVYGNILFGKEGGAQEEKQGDAQSLHFTQSESKPVGFLGRIKEMTKNNPVLVSSLVSLTMSVVMMVGGIMSKGSVTPLYAVAGAFFIAANLMQAAFVRKNDFNVEGAQKEGAPRQQVENISLQSRGDDFGMQPA